MATANNSLMTEYISNYGQRLQSLLQNPTDPTPVTQTGLAGAQPVGQPATTPGTNSLLAAAPAPQQQPRQSQLAAQIEDPDAGAGPGAEGQYTLADLRRDAPKEEWDKAVKELEQGLKAGGLTIDDAYDEMIQKLGTRPSGKLSREDKALLLMEFGLSLMANSRPGVTFGEALGASGLQTLGRYQEMTRGRQKAYDEKLEAIEAQRMKSKSELAKQMALEQGRSISAMQEEELRRGRVAGTITGEGGDVYTYTAGGQVSALSDPETGQRIKGRQPDEPVVPVQQDDGSVVYMPRSQAVGQRRPPPASQLDKPFSFKSTDSNTIYKQSAGLFGGTFDPLSGRIAGLNREQAEIVQRIASRASQIYMEAQGQLDHATAVDMAFREERAKATAPVGAPDAGAQRKTLGGKTYVKVDGKWYLEE